jgi:hypothetical protein
VLLADDGAMLEDAPKSSEWHDGTDAPFAGDRQESTRFYIKVQLHLPFLVPNETYLGSGEVMLTRVYTDDEKTMKGKGKGANGAALPIPKVGLHAAMSLRDRLSRRDPDVVAEAARKKARTSIGGGGVSVVGIVGLNINAKHPLK